MRFVVYFLLLSGCTVSTAQEHPTQKIERVYWSDGDSGQIIYENGEKLKFRLSNIDAPETGGVGAAIGGAKCELERELGFEAKAFVNSFTKSGDVTIANEYGMDKYDRLVVDLSVAGADVSNAGVNAGHLKEWPHKGRRQLMKKPDWCAGN